MMAGYGISTSVARATAIWTRAVRARDHGALTLGVALVAMAACSSPDNDKSEQPRPSAGSSAASGGAPTATGGSAGSVDSAGRGNPNDSAGTTSGGSGSGSAGSASGGTAGASGSASVGGAAQCRNDVSDAEWEANCVVCAAEDACGGCLCENCATELQACDRTPGCDEIAACVQAAGCQGIDCYCGTDNPALCAAGGGNGPCKDVILGAPGGKAPTLTQPSAGPASDAVTNVATCMQNQSTCGALCN